MARRRWARYVAGALAYGDDSVSTNRTAPLATTDSFTASFSALDFAAQVETGIHFDWLSPYSPRASRPSTRRPTGRLASSAGADFALAFVDSTTYSSSTELGVQLAKYIAIHNGKTL